MSKQPPLVIMVKIINLIHNILLVVKREQAQFLDHDLSPIFSKMTAKNELVNSNWCDPNFRRAKKKTTLFVWAGTSMPMGDATFTLTCFKWSKVMPPVFLYHSWLHIEVIK